MRFTMQRSLTTNRFPSSCSRQRIVKLPLNLNLVRSVRQLFMFVEGGVYMANLPNRAQYGNISCIFAVFKSRFARGGIFTVSSLKFDETSRRNALSFCPGAVPLAPALGDVYTPVRTNRCPHFKNTGSSLRSGCQMVHSLTYDGQKGRPVGSTAVMLEVLGLSEEVNGAAFPTRGNQRWTAFATRCFAYNWGNAALTSLLENKLQAYGPLLHLANELSKAGRTQITRSQAKDIFELKNSTDVVSVTCSNGSSTQMAMADGNTTPDTASRNTTTMMRLAMALGMVSTPNFVASGNTQDLVGVSTWLNNNPRLAGARRYDVDLSRVNQILNNPTLQGAIHCKHFTTKGTHRNSGAGCACGCGTRNLMNINKSAYDPISRQRKLLLCEALREARDRGQRLDLNRLASLTNTNPKFSIDTTTHLNQLINVDLHNISLYGAIHSFDNSTNLLTPLVNIPTGAFGTLDTAYIDPAIMGDITTILSNTGLFI